MQKGMIFCLTLALLLSFCACSNGKTTEIPTEEKEYLIDPAMDFVATVDEAGWEAAMLAENFENVTVNAYSSDSEGKPWAIVKVAGSCSYRYRFVISQEAGSDGPAYHEYHYYYYTENGAYYTLDNTVTTNQTTGEVTTKYALEQTPTYAGITSWDFEKDDLMQALKGQYSCFTYDEKEKLYVGTLEGMDTEIEVSFQNGKLVYVKAEWEDGSWQSQEYINYGTTTIEIPEKG